MSKILFAVVVAVCAFQVMIASPVPEKTSEDFRVPPYHEVYDEKWWNASSVLETIEKVLSTIEQGVAEISTNLEVAVKNALDAIEKAALEHADRWNATITEWVERAEAAGVDIRECLQKNDVAQLPVIADELKQEARNCVTTEIDNAKQAIADVRLVADQAKELLLDAKEVVEKCSQEENVILSGACYAQEIPYLGVRAGRIAVNAAILSTRAAAQVAAVPAKASFCVSKAAASKGAKAAKIVESTVKCIREKLSNQ